MENAMTSFRVCVIKFCNIFEREKKNNKKLEPGSMNQEHQRRQLRR